MTRAEREAVRDDLAGALMARWGVQESDESAYDMACADVDVILGALGAMDEITRTLLADSYAYLLTTVPYNADHLPEYETEPYALLRRLRAVLDV